MKRYILIAALAALCGQAQAGIRCGVPVRKAAANLRAKFEAKPIRSAVLNAPAKIVEAAPVRSVVRECVNGVCGK